MRQILLWDIVILKRLYLIEWSITDEADTVMGYSCTKAIASFRGRIWHVWFTMDIPVGMGPWKLCGLPGLIMKAEDSEHLFIYEAVGISSGSGHPVIVYDDKKIKCSRADVLRLNDLRWIDSDYLAKITYGKEVLSIGYDEYGNVSEKKHESEIVIPQKELE